MEIRKNYRAVVVAGALFGAMLSHTGLSENLIGDKGALARDNQNSQTSVRSPNPSPKDNLQSDEQFFDFLGHVAEWAHTITHLHSGVRDRTSYQMMAGNGVRAFKFVDAVDEIANVQFHWKTLDARSQVTRCEWESSLSLRTWVGLRFSLRVPTVISGTPGQALVASNGSNSQEFGCTS